MQINLANWFKNKIKFENGKAPALNDKTLNDLQDNIENDLMNAFEGGITIEDNSLPIGSGCDYFGMTAPEGFMFADGSAISRTEYAALFEIIGTIYGEGDGETTFNLPDKRERVSVMYKEDSTDFGTLGGKTGSSSTTLVAANLPSQTGTLSFHGSNEGSVIHQVSGVFANSTKKDNTYRMGEQTTGASSYPTVKFDNGGKSTPISNVQPTLVCNYIIKVK